MPNINKILYFYINPNFKNKSNYWIFVFIRDYEIIIIHDLDYNEDNDIIVFVDDCIYSGDQMSNLFENLNNKLKLNFYLLCSYISNEGLILVIKKFNSNKNLKDSFLKKMLSLILTNTNSTLIINKYVIIPPVIDDFLTKDELIIMRRYYKGFTISGKHLIYFDHKLADMISTITNIYSGYVLNKNNNELKIIPVMNNCQNTLNTFLNVPQCPFTPYKKF